jgi:uncharacterized membrane protein YoaT (DUF817 family)
MSSFLWEFFLFGVKQARACLFAAAFFTLLFLSKHIPLFGLARYDFLCLATVLVQALLLWTRIETAHEALVLCAFHALGLTLELFKTHPAIGSWSYPEDGFLKIGSVPLYSGFMYAAVASYMCQAWRLLRLELVGYPPYRITLPLAAAIYLNFFTHHFIPDVRWLLIALVVWTFRRTQVHFTPWRTERTMPLALSYLLIGFFVWIAENISTYLGAWVYPGQRVAWSVVSLNIISSWSLLVIVSFLIVADLKHRRARRARTELSFPRSAWERMSSTLRVGSSGPIGEATRDDAERHDAERRRTGVPHAECGNERLTITPRL